MTAWDARRVVTYALTSAERRALVRAAASERRTVSAFVAEAVRAALARGVRRTA